MDKKTKSYYQNNAEELTQKYDSVSDGISRYFSEAFNTHDRVLDIGCGSGRDVSILLEQGMDAYGIEPCSEFLDIIQREKRELKDRVSAGSLPQLEGIEHNSFDGVVCSAVLMHLPEERLFDAAVSIRSILKESGRLLLSIPGNSPSNADTKRDENGRFFNGVAAEHLKLIFERIGFQLLNSRQDGDSLGRSGRSWVTMIFELKQ